MKINKVERVSIFKNKLKFSNIIAKLKKMSNMFSGAEPKVVRNKSKYNE
jgi:hypothetical protein